MMNPVPTRVQVTQFHELNLQPGEDIIQQFRQYSDEGNNIVWLINFHGSVKEIHVWNDDPGDTLEYTVLHEGDFQLVSLHSISGLGFRVTAFNRRNRTHVAGTVLAPLLASCPTTIKLAECPRVYTVVQNHEDEGHTHPVFSHVPDIPDVPEA